MNGFSIHNNENMKSWTLSGLITGNSRIHGTGIFTTRNICFDEVAIVFKGTLFSLEEIRAGKARHESITGYDIDTYIGAPSHSVPHIDDYLNHSCEPNLWLANPTTVIARRDISTGEELTIDYGTWEIDVDWKLPALCNCRTELCRRFITGRDWMNAAVQHRYRGHFLPCLEARIEAMERSERLPHQRFKVISY